MPEVIRILVETDAPYLTPVPYRGKRNEPKYVEYVLEEISFQRKINKKELDKITTLNFYNLFGGGND